MEISYVLPDGYTPIFAIPYTRSWFAQVSLGAFNNGKVGLTIYNTWMTPQDIIIGAYVLVKRSSN